MSSELQAEISRLSDTLRLAVVEARVGIESPHLAYNACCAILELLDYTFTAQRGNSFDERLEGVGR